MRAMLLVVALLASHAHAATIRTGSVSHTINTGGAAELDGFMQLGTGGYIRATVPDLTVADVGSIFTVTEATAEDYDFDWAFAETLMFGTGRARFTFTVGSIVDGNLHGTKQSLRGSDSYTMLGLVDLKLRLASWEGNTARLVGTIAYLTPEPSSLLLAMLGLAGGFVRRR